MASQDKNLVIVRSVRDQGLTPTQAATKYGISKRWVNTLLSRYDANGPDGVKPKTKTPKNNPQTTNPIIKNRIIELRNQLNRQGADAGPVTIQWHLEKEGLQAPSTSTIRRILNNAGMINPEPRKRPKTSYVRFQAELPNECWQADITHWFLTDGRRIEILDFLDDHSRYLLSIHAATAFTGTDVVTAMQANIDTYGPPAATLTDNGLVFTARLAGRKGGRNGFEKLLQAHDIKQKNGKPGHPQTQGKIERFHQTLKKWLTARPRPATIKELNNQLDEYRNWYNQERPHRAINRQTPHTAYTALPKAKPNHKPEPEYRTRTDKIDKAGKVSLRYAGKLRHLGIGRAYKNTPILMPVKDNEVKPQTSKPEK